MGQNLRAPLLSRKLQQQVRRGFERSNEDSAATAIARLEVVQSSYARRALIVSPNALGIIPVQRIGQRVGMEPTAGRLHCSMTDVLRSHPLGWEDRNKGQGT